MPASSFVCSPLELDRRTLNEVAVLGARSFYDDPFFRFLSEESNLRSRGIFIYLRSHVAALGDTAVATGVRNEDGILVGVCVWQRPGTFPLPAVSQARDVVGALWAMIPRPKSLVSGLRYTMAIERERPKEDHWYLSLLAADPMVWRRGVGTSLLDPSLDAVDADGLPAYLETQKEANLAFYHRFGFEETKRLTPCADGPPLFTMTRMPR